MHCWECGEWLEFEDDYCPECGSDPDNNGNDYFDEDYEYDHDSSNEPDYY